MNKIIIPGEYMLAMKPWQSTTYRVEVWLSENGWPFRNYDLTNQTERLSTRLDRNKLKITHLPDRSVEVIYYGQFV